MKEDLEEVKNEVSFAMEMLEYSKEQNTQLTDNFKKMYRVWIITFTGLVLCLIASVGYIIYLLNDIGTIEDSDSIEIVDVETIDNTHIKIGDDVWEKSQ